MRTRNLKRIDIITLFPKMFEGPLTESLLGRARANGVIDLRIHNLRDFSIDARHHAVDDRPFGGGAGMVIQAEPLYRALKAVRKGRKDKPYVIYLSPQGTPLTQSTAQKLSQKPWLVLVCGHYEGIDERVMRWIDAEVSIGDYVLTGGELPAMVLADAVIRLVPGVVKEAASIRQDLFQVNRLDHPHYTRPATWRGHKVPAVLLSGNHQQIEAWRFEQSTQVTAKKRPDLAAITNAHLPSGRPAR